MDRSGAKFVALLSLFLSQNAHLVDGKCSHVSVSSSWDGGYSVDFNIPVQTTTKRWSIDVTFSSPVTSLESWDAKPYTDDNVIFHLRSYTYNKRLLAGSVLNSVGLNVHYPTADPVPDIVNVAFNGYNLCKGRITPFGSYKKANGRKKSATSTTSEPTSKTTTTKPTTTKLTTEATTTTKPTTTTKSTTPKTTTTATTTKLTRFRTTTTANPTKSTTSKTTTAAPKTKLTTSKPTTVIKSTASKTNQTTTNTATKLTRFRTTTTTTESPTTTNLVSAIVPTTTPASTVAAAPMVPPEFQSMAELVDSWEQGFAIDFHIPFTTNTTRWKLAVRFSADFECLAVEGADSMEFPSRTAVVIGSFASQPAGSVFDGVKMNVIYKTFPVRITDISVNESFGAGGNVADAEVLKSRYPINSHKTRRIPEAHNVVFDAAQCSRCTYDNQCGCMDASIVPSRTCGSIFETDHQSSYNSSETLRLPFPEAVTSWTVRLTFSTPVNSIEAAGSVTASDDHLTYEISNSSWDANQCAGSVLTTRFNMFHDEPKPVIMGAILNGQIICTGA